MTHSLGYMSGGPGMIASSAPISLCGLGKSLPSVGLNSPPCISWPLTGLLAQLASYFLFRRMASDGPSRVGLLRV